MVMRGIFVLVLVATTAGCATFGRAPLTVTTACSLEQAWDASLESVKHLTLHHTDKDKGVIVTEWTTMTSGQKAGVFERKANRERTRFFLTLEPDQQAVTISVRQAREYFSPMGVQSQSTRWRRIPPLAGDEQRLVQQLSEHLKETGCAVLR